MKEEVIPGVSWEDSWVASHFSAALCYVFFSSYTDEKADWGLTGPHCPPGGIAPSPSAVPPLTLRRTHGAITAAFRRRESTFPL